jgi:NDP-sugar pyrophosphorylase family protein
MILNSKIIICAGGDGGAKWGMHLGVPKHMIPAHGEPLVHRIQRQLLERDFTNVHLACSRENKEKYLLEGVQFILSPPRTGHIGENACAWHYRKHIDYEGTTVILYGDVYYTDEFMNVLCKDSNDKFRIYGRSDVSQITKNHRQGEPFAIILTKDSIENKL